MRIAFVIALLLAGSTTAAAASSVASTCGGKERWSVKTGTDAGGRQINVSAVQQTTVASLLALAAPAKRSQAERVSDPTHTETTVFSVTAFLTNYKTEGDKDYHLVIADENDNTMVVEVPNPACIHGSSPFAPLIEATRQTVDQKIKVKTSFLPADVKIAVRVTGVGFFDLKGHGTGGTKNGIELHPVLRIEFDPAGLPSTPTVVAPATSTAQLLRDPGFEAGASGSAWSASADVLTKSTKRDGHSGSSYAWLGGVGTVHTDTLSQQVTLPTTGTRITLSYWIAIDTKERISRGSFEDTDIFDTLTLEVRSNGGRSERLARFSNLNAHSGYTQVAADLTPYRGQTITLVFTSAEDRSLQTSFLLDDLSLDVE